MIPSMLERIWLALIVAFIAGWGLIVLAPDLGAGQLVVYVTGFMLPALGLFALGRWILARRPMS